MSFAPIGGRGAIQVKASVIHRMRFDPWYDGTLPPGKDCAVGDLIDFVSDEGLLVSRMEILSIHNGIAILRKIHEDSP
jgi:hypothetical protein